MALIGLGCLTGCSRSDPAPALPVLKIDPARVSVSGVSSGAYMAAQAHVAFSTRIHAAAMLAGGPYGCAQGSLDRALADCMKGTPAPDVAALIARATTFADAGQIDPIAGLADDPVFIAHGSSDPIVNNIVSQAAIAFQQGIAPTAPLQVSLDQAYGHLWPRSQAGNCQPDAGYMADCGFDMAAAMATALEPATASPASAPPSAPGKLLVFDQNLKPELASNAKLDDAGFLYVPAACEQEACGLHVIFHGCEMNREKIGDAFAADPDWHRQADARHLVLLYPQTVSSLMPLNPKGCWDWWGYTGEAYDQKHGAQLQWLDAVFLHFGLTEPN
ncbi:PHB depolymerase family esterase [Ahniella affigens]|nr:PHB depolymerase family esterase [Ahniella affigens]